METTNAIDFVESVKNKYEDRIISLLNKLREGFVSSGLSCDEVEFMDGMDEFTWNFIIDNEKEEDKVYVSFSIIEESYYDNDESDGINFRIDIVKYGGEMLGDFAPYNFTEKCWIDSKNPYAVEERFKMMEQLDVYGTVIIVINSIGENSNG